MRDLHIDTFVCAALCSLLGGVGCAAEHSPQEPEGKSPRATNTAAVQAHLAFVPDFPGAGNSGADAPLAGGMLCDTVTRTRTKLTDPTTSCFFQTGQTQPSATLEQVLECVEGVNAVHLRLTFDPAFVDNTYGANAIGWDRGGPTGRAGPMPPAPMPPATMPPNRPGKGAPMMPPGMIGHGKAGHSFMDLVGSDHAELVVTNQDGELVSQFKLDYISVRNDTLSGYASLGVRGGDGKMIVGDAADIVQWRTSLERNLNERGYEDYTADSPVTDEGYAINADAPNWDYRVVYEAWVADEVFGDSGFGGAKIEHVHASPSKAPSDTIEVTPGECPCEQDGGCETPPPNCELAPEDPTCQLG